MSISHKLRKFLSLDTVHKNVQDIVSKLLWTEQQFLKVQQQNENILLQLKNMLEIQNQHSLFLLHLKNGQQSVHENILQHIYHLHPKIQHELEISFLSIFQETRARLHVKDVLNLPWVRVGRDYDGGYVMADEFNTNPIVYSFGICDDVSWDIDMAHRIKNTQQKYIYLFDHTIETLPETHPAFIFSQQGIGGKSPAPGTKSMSDILSENGHGNHHNIILKMDVEGSEWDFLEEVSEKTLKQFTQIVFEFHNLGSPSNCEAIFAGLDKLNKTHQLVHIHANNYSDILCIGGILLPTTLEATYLRKSDHIFSNSVRIFPTELDRPNAPWKQDPFLGMWNS